MSLHGAGGRQAPQGSTDRLCVRGRIIDAERRPLAGALVSSYYSLDAGTGTRSADDGSFEILLKPGQSMHLLRVRLPGHSEGKSWLRETDAAAEIEISLAVGASLRGRVLTPSGDPASYAEVSLGPCWSRSDAHGQFRIDDLPIGSQRLRVHAEGWAALQYPVELSPGERTEGLLLKLQPGQSIRGRLRDDRGRAIRAALVSAPVPALRSHARSTFTDGEGYFLLPDLPPELRCIEVSGPGFATFSVAVREPVEFLEISVARAEVDSSASVEVLPQ